MLALALSKGRGGESAVVFSATDGLVLFTVLNLTLTVKVNAMNPYFLMVSTDSLLLRN